MDKRYINFDSGSHGNFLSYALNILDRNQYFDLPPSSLNYDLISKFNKLDYRFEADHQSSIKFGIPDDIVIKIDNEILWLHQVICRTTNKNYYILDYEKHFAKLSINHPILSGMVNRYFFQKRKKNLEFFYENYLFGFYKHLPCQSIRANFEFPFSSFYSLEKFDHYITELVPHRNGDLMKKLHRQFMANIKHTDQNIANIGSILYKTWKKYRG